MDVRVLRSARPTAAELASKPAFHFGPLLIDPPMRQICAGDRCEKVEPRVMRVLLALCDTPGRVLSRDELIDQCWDGQIVTDNAITRVVSLLRRVLSELGGRKLALETIPKVGFRLVLETSCTLPDQDQNVSAADDVSADAIPRQGKWTRRAALGGLAMSAGAGVIWTFANREWIGLRISGASASQLYRQGQDIQKSGEPGSSRRALEYYKRAVAIDESFAPAWGALALSYRHPAQGGNEFRESRTDQPQLIRAAADRALALDADNSDARFAMAAIDPYYRHWLREEAHFRTLLRRYSSSAIGNGLLGLLLTNVGRMEDALPLLRRVLASEPKLAIAWGQLAMVLHHAHRDQEAHRVLDIAFSKFPRHHFLWNVRYLLLIGSKRYDEAAAFVRDPNSLPDLIGKAIAEQFAKIAEALADGRASAETARTLICAMCESLEPTPFLAPMFAACGARQELFDLLDAYYFGGSFNGQRFAQPGIVDERLTFMLFMPSLVPYRADSRFGAILKRTGLEEYWRRSGTQPDFRRTSNTSSPI